MNKIYFHRVHGGTEPRGGAPQVNKVYFHRVHGGQSQGGSQVNKVNFHCVHGGQSQGGVLSEQVCTCRYGKLEDPYVGMGAGMGECLWTTHGHVQVCSLRDLTSEETN